MAYLTAIRRHYLLALRFIGIGSYENPRLAKAQKWFFRGTVASISYMVAFASVKTGFFDVSFIGQLQLHFVACAVAMASAFLVFCLLHQTCLEECFDWCEAQQSRESEEGPSKRLFEACESRASKIFRWVPVLPIVLASVLVLQTLALSLLEGRLEPPLPLYLWDTLFHRLLALIVVFMETFSLSSAICLVLGTIYVTFTYAKCCIECLEVEIRAVAGDERRFLVAIERVVERHCECIEQLEKLTGKVKLCLMCFDLLTRACLLFLWVTIFFIPELVIISAIGSGLVLVFAFLCHINESFKDALESYRQALYDIEWFFLSPEQRKLLIPIMIMAGRPTLLTVGPFQVLNFETFAAMLNSIYSHGMVINKLVQ